MSKLEFYDIDKDLKKVDKYVKDNNLPPVWCYAIYSARGPGKTFSTLWTAYRDKKPIVVMKRTIEDIDLICQDINGESMNPYNPINKVKGTNIRPFKIGEGRAICYKCDSDGEKYGDPVSYWFALAKISKLKGFDLAQVEWLVFDEFIPQRGEVVRKVEGDMFLSLYPTINRNRESEGREPLKMILLANTTEIYTPLTATLEIVDDMVNMIALKQSEKLIKDRGIYLHHLTEEKFNFAKNSEMAIFNGMKDTKWGASSFGATFAYNDFSNIKHKSIKKMKCIIKLIDYNKAYYIYINNDTGEYYMTYSKSNNPEFVYNLNRENDCKKFFIDFAIDLKNSCVDGFMDFETYTMYNIIVNFKKLYNV